MYKYNLLVMMYLYLMKSLAKHTRKMIRIIMPLCNNHEKISFAYMCNKRKSIWNTLDKTTSPILTGMGIAR
jgi:hypothetical protein